MTIDSTGAQLPINSVALGMPEADCLPSAMVCKATSCRSYWRFSFILSSCHQVLKPSAVVVSQAGVEEVSGQLGNIQGCSAAIC